MTDSLATSRGFLRHASEPMLISGSGQRAPVAIITRKPPSRKESRTEVQLRSDPVPIQDSRSPRWKREKSTHTQETGDSGREEIRQIMQGVHHAGSPVCAYLGSPPPRGGASNPLVQDCNWQRNAYSASHSNLQELREIDAQISFLRSNSVGDCRLLIGSPDFGSLLSDSPDEHFMSRIQRAKPIAVPARSACR